MLIQLGERKHRQAGGESGSREIGWIDDPTRSYILQGKGWEWSANDAAWTVSHLTVTQLPDRTEYCSAIGQSMSLFIMMGNEPKTS